MRIEAILPASSKVVTSAMSVSKRLPLAGAGAETARRTAWFDGEEHEAQVIAGEPAPGTEVTGPAICELPEATLVLPPGWSAQVDAAGTILAEGSQTGAQAAAGASE